MRVSPSPIDPDMVGMSPPVASERRSVGFATWAAAVMLLALGTVWITRPLFGVRDAVPRSAGTVSSMGDADLNLNLWILAWVAHVVADRPAGVKLFDANIFYPAPDALAASENMLGHAPLTAPVWRATRNVALVFKAVVLESYVLTGLATFWLIVRRTGDRFAALAAASAFAFFPLRWISFAQPQYFASQYLVLSLGALDAWRDSGRDRWLVIAAAGLVLQALTCLYMGYYGFLSVGAYGLALIAFAGAPRWGRFLRLMITLTLSSLAAAPIGLPYLRARSIGVVPVHTLDEMVPVSLLPQVLFSRLSLVPFGVVLPLGLALACAVYGVTLARRWGAARATSPITPSEGATWILLGFAILMAMGPFALVGGHWIPLPYQIFYRLIPGFSSLRVPGRFAFVIALAIAMLMGGALARIARRSRAGAATLALASIVGALAWSGWRPIATAILPIDAWRAGVYARLAAEPITGGVLELPSTRTEGDLLGNVVQSRYMVASSIHWWPLLNGYTAYHPPSYRFLMSLVRELPDASVLRRLHGLVALRWILVHTDMLDPEERARWQVPPPGLDEVRRFGSDLLLRVTLPEPATRPPLEGRSTSGTTLGGVSRGVLDEACRAAALTVQRAPKAIFRPAPLIRVDVEVANLSRCVWPAFDVGEGGLVMLHHRWLGPDRRELSSGGRIRLTHDVPPGESLEVRATTFAPGGPPGAYTLELRLAQVGLDEPLASATVPIEIVAPVTPVTPTAPSALRR